MLVKLKDIIYTVPDKKYQIKNSEIQSQGRFPVVDQSSTMSGFYDVDKCFDKGECILFADHTSRIFYMGQKFIIGCDGMKIIKIKDGLNINQKFVYFALCNNYQGDGKWRRHFGDFQNCTIDLPDRKTQDKIAEILSGIDEQIERNNELVKRLQVLSNTIYRRWFLQFDFPDENGRPYRSSGGKMSWNDILKCEIPVNWRNSVIANHIGTYKSGDWGKETAVGNYQKNVNCIRGADLPCVENGGAINAPTRYILSKNSNRILSPGDILVEISGGSPTQSTGRICYINNTTLNRFKNNIIVSNFCKAFCMKNSYEQYWLFLLWQTLYSAGVLFCFEGKTTGIKNLLFEDFCTRYPIVYPNEEVLKEFHKLVSPIFEYIQIIGNENDELIKLRDVLLPLLINNQLST